MIRRRESQYQARGRGRDQVSLGHKNECVNSAISSVSFVLGEFPLFCCCCCFFKDSISLPASGYISLKN